MGCPFVSRLSPARAAAHEVLFEASRHHGYARDLLTQRTAAKKLDERDAAFAARLALGVTATEGILDELLDRYISKPKKVAPRVRIALRIAAFEMLYMDTPAHIAVSQGVELVRKSAKEAAGLANAVLRKVAEAVPAYRAAEDVPEGERRQAFLSRMLGLPAWLAQMIMERFDQSDGSGIRFAGNLTPAPMAVHVNPRASREERLPDGLVVPVFPGCFAPVEPKVLIQSGAFERASAVASDLNAQLVATAATREGSCLEVGAGRGTKTFVMASQAARLGLKRRHYALDLHERKCDQNIKRLRRAELGGVKTIAGDACELDQALLTLDALAGERAQFDTVLVDAPCSGTGTMRHHPEIPWRLKEEDVRSNLPALQLGMLCEASKRVKRGGELFYATCSVLPAENDEVVTAFLKSPQGKRFRLAPVSEADIFEYEAYQSAKNFLRSREDERGLFQSAPYDADSFDGHFCARLICS